MRTITYDGEYAPIYTYRGDYSYERHTPDWSVWRMGVIFTVTNTETGTTYYARVRRKGGGSGGSYSTWSEVKQVTIPAAPGEGEPVSPPTAPFALTCAPQSSAHPENVRLDWQEREGSTPDAEFATYDIQWTANAGAFADNAATSQHYTVTGLDRGKQWWFRVRKVNDLGNSGWAEAEAGDTWASPTVCTLTIAPEAENLSAPTTTSTLAGYEAGETIVIGWTHNSEQDSEQTEWEVGIRATINEVVTEGIISGTGADGVMSLTLDSITIDVDGTATTVTLSDGAVVEWRARTKGVTDWSPWSGWRAFSIWDAPAVSIGLLNGLDLDVADYGLTCMPLTVEVTAAGFAEDNAPVEWWAEIVALDGYDVSAYDGRGTYVPEGMTMWQGSISSGDDGFSRDGWSAKVSVFDVSLTNGMRYEVRAGAVTAQGVRAEAEPYEVTPEWSSTIPTPSADVWFDDTQLSCHVALGCVIPPDESDMETVTAAITSYTSPQNVVVFSVDYGTGEGQYIEVKHNGTTLPRDAWRVMVFPRSTASPPYDQVNVYILESSGLTLPTTVTVTYGPPTPRHDVRLGVWRIESNGSLVELANDLPSDIAQEIIDPHATFGSASYRIIATDDGTGEQGACDVTCPSPIDHAVIQWAEATRIDAEETWDTSAFAGNHIELPFDLTLSERYAPDAVLREYAGRKHPVAYYGTQRGQTMEMTTNVVRDMDGRSIAMLRYLADSMTPVYVRTPSGLGFWAHVAPSMSGSYGSAAVAVSLDVTRVDVPEGEVP